VSSSPRSNSRETQALERLGHFKQSKRDPAAPLGPEMISFFKNAVQKRQTKLAKIAECWSVLVPQTLDAHCSLEGLSRGTLTVLVDSSSHLYELKQLLLAGIEDQLFLACKSAGLRKINLKPGRWYESPEDDAQCERKPRFRSSTKRT
jgi:hypothetical protein